MNETLTALLQMGFSFACCGVCMWYVYYLTKTNNLTNSKFLERLASLEAAIERLSDRIGGGSDGNKY